MTKNRFLIIVCCIVLLVFCGIFLNLFVVREIMDENPLYNQSTTNEQALAFEETVESSMQKDLEKKKEVTKSDNLEEKMPLFEFDKSSQPQEAAIFEYLSEMGYHYENDGTVTIPAFCIFLSELTEDNLIKVHGNFGMDSYLQEQSVLVCESGCVLPGVIYLKVTSDGYVVDHMERVRDGAMYLKDIERICGDNHNLKNQYLEYRDALETTRLWNIYQYVKKNNLNITAYQDGEGAPIPLSEVEGWNEQENDGI